MEATASWSLSAASAVVGDGWIEEAHETTVAQLSIWHVRRFEKVSTRGSLCRSLWETAGPCSAFFRVLWMDNSDINSCEYSINYK